MQNANRKANELARVQRLTLGKCCTWDRDAGRCTLSYNHPIGFSLNMDF